MLDTVLIEELRRSQGLAYCQKSVCSQLILNKKGCKRIFTYHQDLVDKPKADYSQLEY